MFYSTLILAKKGKLGHIWLAAHSENALKKKDILEMSIEDSVGM